MFSNWFRLRSKEPAAALGDSTGLPRAGDVEVLEAIKKGARAHAKLEALLEARFDAMEASTRGQIESLRASVNAKAATGVTWDGLLDALDLLEQAARSIPTERDDGTREGLDLVLARLARFLEREAGIVRVGEPGQAVNGKQFRVIGTEPSAEIAPGTIVRVLRAAALRDGVVVREGEVIATRSGV
jgi:molecular chaperone GrpE (heat shock protein)